MKLKKIKIHNIASIADAEIDFEGWQLRDESIFLICGETGSGKTTILDAICLALYNKTPRLSQASIRESYMDRNGESITLTNPVQYVRKGSWEASVELDFESGGRNWKSIWSTHRANKNPDGKFQGITWELLDLESGTSSKGSEAETITGLSFDEFRRTTMLAQGEFTAFLKSRDEEKSAILEKITGTGIYKRIGRLIGEKFREANSACNARAEAIRTLKENILDECEENKIKDDIEKLKQKACDLEKERTASESLVKILEEIPRLEKEISGYLAKFEDAADECARLKGSIAFAEDVLKIKETRIEELEGYFRSVSENSSMFADSERIIYELERIEDAEKKISASLEAITSINASISIQEASRNACLEISRQKEKEYKIMSEQLKVLMDEQSSRNPDALRKEKEAIGLIRSIRSNEANHSELEIAAARTEEMYRETFELHEKIKESNSQWAKDARANLYVGGDCPVCGQKISTQEYLASISDAHFESVLKPVKETLRHRQTEKEKAAARLMECTAQLKLQKERLEEISEGDKYTDISEERYNEICSCLEACEKAAEEITKVSEELTSLHKQNSDAAKALTDAELDLEKSKVNLNTEKKTIEDAISKKEEALAKAEDKISWKDWKETWGNDRKAFVSRLRLETQEYLEALAEYKNHIGVIGTIREGMANIRLSYEEIISLMPSYADVPCGEKVKTERLESRLNDLKASIANAISGKSEAEKKLESHKATAGSCQYEALRQRLDELTPELNATNQTIGSYTKTLEDSNRNSKGLKEDLKLLEKLEKDRDQWKALNDVFGKKDGEYFQKIAQGFIMNDILSKANFYLKGMSGRYRLEAQQGTLNIVMIDLEQGGVPRSTSTISGGESFIISLALALGLSSSGTGKISADILFIDEGFGSLSEEYLNTVIETLERLHETSGKKVGIISHIPALRQRINTKIFTSKTNGSTSKVEILTGDD